MDRNRISLIIMKAPQTVTVRKLIVFWELEESIKFYKDFGTVPP